MRLFAAALIPEPVASRIDALRRDLGVSDVERLMPHITLAPPREVAPDDVASAEEAVRATAAGLRPLVVVLGPLATFSRRNVVVFLAVRGDVDPLAGAQAALVTSLPAGTGAGGGATVAHPMRPFVPHVTLARIRDARVRAGAVERYDAWRAEVVLDTVALMERDASRRWVARTRERLGGAIG